MRPLIALALIALFPSLISAQTLQDAQKEIDNEHYYKAKMILFRLMNDGSVNKSDVAYYLGNAYLKTDDVDSARIFYKMVNGAESKYFYTFLATGRIALLDKNVTAAQASFEKASTVTKYKNALVFFEIGDAYFRPNVIDVNLAIKNLEDAYELDNKNCSIMMELGDAYLENSVNDNQMGGKAMNKYEAASDLCKANALAWIKIGRLSMRGRIYDEAEDAYKKAEQIEPTNPLVHKELGEVYYMRKAFDSMIVEFKKYLDLSPGDTKARIDILNIYFNNGDFDKCATEAAKGLKTDPNNIDYFRFQIYSDYELKRYKDGNDAIQKFWQTPGIKPKFRDYYYSARIAGAVGDTAGEIKYYKSAINMDSTNCDLLGEFAKSLYQLRYYDQAIVWYNAKKGKCSLTSLDIYFLGRSYMLNGDSLLADTTFGDFIRLNPTSPDGYFQKARVNVKIGAQEDYNAYPYYQKYIDLAPDPAKYKGNLIEAYDYVGLYYAGKLKDKAKAMEFLNKALDLDSNDENTKDFIDAVKKQFNH